MLLCCVVLCCVVLFSRKKESGGWQSVRVVLWVGWPVPYSCDKDDGVGLMWEYKKCTYTRVLKVALRCCYHS